MRFQRNLALQKQQVEELNRREASEALLNPIKELIAIEYGCMRFWNDPMAASLERLLNVKNEMERRGMSVYLNIREDDGGNDMNVGINGGVGGLGSPSFGHHSRENSVSKNINVLEIRGSNVVQMNDGFNGRELGNSATSKSAETTANQSASSAGVGASISGYTKSLQPYRK